MNLLEVTAGNESIWKGKKIDTYTKCKWSVESENTCAPDKQCNPETAR